MVYVSSSIHARRKLFLGIFPYLINIASELGVISKFDASKILSQRSVMEENKVTASLKKLLKDRVQITRMDDTLVVHLDRMLLMKLIEEYLRNEYLDEGAFAASFYEVNFSVGKVGLAAVMRLPHKYVYVSIQDESVVTQQLEEMVADLAPNHLIVLTADKTKVKDAYYGPKFISENRVEWGRVRFLHVAEVLEKIAGIDCAYCFRLSPNGVTFSLKLST